MSTTIARFSVIKAGNIQIGRRLVVLVNASSVATQTTQMMIKINNQDYGADSSTKSVVVGDIVELYITTDLQSSWSGQWSGYKFYGNLQDTDTNAERYCLISSFDAEVDLTYIIGVDYLWYGKYRSFFRSSSSYPCCLATINSSAQIEFWSNTSYDYQKVFQYNTTLRYIANGNFISLRPTTYNNKNGLCQSIFEGCTNLVSLPNKSFELTYNSNFTSNEDTFYRFAYQSGLKQGVVGRSVDITNINNQSIWYFANQSPISAIPGQRISYYTNEPNLVYTTMGSSVIATKPASENSYMLLTDGSIVEAPWNQIAALAAGTQNIPYQVGSRTLWKSQVVGIYYGRDSIKCRYGDYYLRLGFNLPNLVDYIEGYPMNLSWQLLNPGIDGITIRNDNSARAFAACPNLIRISSKNRWQMWPNLSFDGIEALPNLEVLDIPFWHNYGGYSGLLRNALDTASPKLRIVNTMVSSLSQSQIVSSNADGFLGTPSLTDITMVTNNTANNIVLSNFLSNINPDKINSIKLYTGNQFFNTLNYSQNPVLEQLNDQGKIQVIGGANNQANAYNALYNSY